ncbi:MAG: cysteine synthase [Ignavibacteria bacterium GWB2_35_12]|nr:MAG: cysteine synthase [Ignavibacteria bacterium GWB2_35_12]OGU92988.1 MAG: cysteine synthase [Ignavibacteria bacterium RIFOXYA2_FULL_35_10]OGV22974.1 MAG: cysteine synthase [Ignavibacteria bacterium RIFOXYC2_FULL_35_21]
MEMNKRIQGLSHLIGNTPLLEIDFKYKGKPRRIFVKAENLNMTGSIKDRMAYHILYKAYEKGILKDKTHIIEATSGNTGISFSALGKALGHHVTIFMPDWMSLERLNLIKSLGASIKLVSRDEGGFLGSIQQSKELADKIGDAFLPCQFSNGDNVEAHYNTTGPEIWWQLSFRSIKPHAFVAGVGTGGTIMGVGKFFKEKDKNIYIHPLEPANSPTLTTGHKVGKHRIQGISDEFIPAILKLDELDSVVSVDDGDAIIMAQKLSSELGIGVGISSGANFAGALQIQNELGDDAVVATVFPDDNKKYLSTDLLREEPVKTGFLSVDVELEGFRSHKRVCHTCCDPADCLETYYDDVNNEITLPPCPRRLR